MLSKLQARRVLRAAAHVAPAQTASASSSAAASRARHFSSSTHTALKEKCDAAISEMKASGTYK